MVLPVEEQEFLYRLLDGQDLTRGGVGQAFAEVSDG